jgi:hypothetical protein
MYWGVTFMCFLRSVGNECISWSACFNSKTTCRNLMNFEVLFARIIRMSVQLIVAHISQTYRIVSVTLPVQRHA